MDLGTILKKFGEGEYATAAEFEKDVELMFSNCFEYNWDGDHHAEWEEEVGTVGSRMELEGSSATRSKDIILTPELSVEELIQMRDELRRKKEQQEKLDIISEINQLRADIALRSVHQMDAVHAHDETVNSAASSRGTESGTTKPLARKSPKGIPNTANKGRKYNTNRSPPPKINARKRDTISSSIDEDVRDDTSSDGSASDFNPRASFSSPASTSLPPPIEANEAEALRQRDASYERQEQLVKERNEERNVCDQEWKASRPREGKIWNGMSREKGKKPAIAQTGDCESARVSNGNGSRLPSDIFMKKAGGAASKSRFARGKKPDQKMSRGQPTPATTRNIFASKSPNVNKPYGSAPSNSKNKEPTHPRPPQNHRHLQPPRRKSTATPIHLSPISSDSPSSSSDSIPLARCRRRPPPPLHPSTTFRSAPCHHRSTTFRPTIVSDDEETTPAPRPTPHSTSKGIPDVDVRGEGTAGAGAVGGSGAPSVTRQVEPTVAQEEEEEEEEEEIAHGTVLPWLWLRREMVPTLPSD
ncbi:hypothetical protein HDV00_004030 [Rhizophlyctis rosea]|nr:hypothetical protein HDV00_004030 [Rhizophlyctis rosea]